jgi:hypothetical protein
MYDAADSDNNDETLSQNNQEADQQSEQEQTEPVVAIYD